MRWEELRSSSNTERRRGGGKTMAIGGGIGAIIMAAIAYFVMDKPIGEVIGQLSQSQGQTQAGPAKPQTEREKEIDAFVGKILGSTEDVWTELLPKYGLEYKAPKLINYDGSTPMRTGGMADSRMGPFYVPAEETVYIDTAFFNQMDKELGGGGDFAYAYVIAHEVGHHVQNLTGATTKVHGARGRVSEVEYNQLSVRLELQADFYAGVWAHHANEKHRTEFGRNLLEEGDIEEAMNSAKAIGDDTLQRKAGGRVQPESFSHGTSEQRLKWFIKGIRSGDLSKGDTFSVNYRDL